MMVAGRPDMRFANLRLGKTHSGRKCAYYFAVQVYSNFKHVQRLVVWKRDSGAGLWVSVQDECGNAVGPRIASKIEACRLREEM